MATRALILDQNQLIRPYKIKSGETVTLGKAVVFNTSADADDEVLDATANSESAIGVALFHEKMVNGVLSASSLGNDRFNVSLFAYCVQRMKVGTGGATRGKRLTIVSDGVTDAATSNSGSTVVNIIGFALQTGVVGDYIGVAYAPSSRLTT